jgi:hypothetical protein
MYLGEFEIMNRSKDQTVMDGWLKNLRLNSLKALLSAVRIPARTELNSSL